MSDHTENIHQLLDGELDAIHEPRLYGELATNGDLRAEFRQQLAIRTAIQNDRMALVPPAALTNSVFSSLGFAAPLAAAVTGTAGGGFLLQWFSRIGIPILSAVTAAGITFGVANHTSAPIAGTTQPVSSNQGTPNNTVAPEPQNTAVAGGTTANNVVEKIVYRDRIVPSTSDAQPAQQNSELRNANNLLNAQNQKWAAENERLTRELAQLRSSQSTPVTQNVQSTVAETNSAADVIPITSVRVANTMELHNVPSARMLMPSAVNAEQAFSTYPAYSAQLRGFPLASTLNTGVSEQPAWYNNLGVSLLYHTSPNHSFGLEFGNENFPMIFDANRDGQIIRYEQSPASSWAGVTYRYTANRLGNTAFAPFAQGVLGGTKFGPIGRVAAGIQYSPVGPLTFIFGLEGSAMAYYFQQQWYTSPKYGFTYGMAVKF